MSKTSDPSEDKGFPKNRANPGLKLKDMTPEQRKNWERIRKRKRRKEM